MSTRLKALAFASILVLAAFVVRLYTQHRVPETFESSGPPALGSVGSDHSHQSILVVLEGVPVNFMQSKFLDKSDYAHFHDDGPFIHKHTDGVTLPFFLDTLGITLTPTCLTMDTGAHYCSDESNKLSIYINREDASAKLEFYELHEADKILIDYGTTSPSTLLLELNSIPDLPADISQNG